MNAFQSEINTLESLDQSVLAQLKADMGEDVQEVIDAFLESIDDLLIELRDRSTDLDNTAVSRCAHSIKSSAASVGMMNLSAIAAHLEKSLKRGEAVNIDDLVSQIASEYSHSRNLISN